MNATNTRLVGTELSFAQLYEGLLRSAVDAIIVTDTEGTIRSVSDSTQTLFGHERSELIGNSINCLMPLHHASRHNGYIDRYLETGEKRILGKGRNVEGLHKSGHVFPLHLSISRVQTLGETLFIGICHDLSDYTKVLERAELAEKRYLSILENQRELICRLDAQLNISYANSSMQALLESTSISELESKPFQSIFENTDEVREQLNTFFRSPQAWQQGLRFTGHIPTHTGSCYIDWSFSYIPPGHGESAELQVIGTDETAREEALKTAHFLEHHDPLTRLLNKRAFIDAFNRHKTSEQPYAFIYLNLNRLQVVQHMFSPDATDRIILEAARRIAVHTPATSLATRIYNSDFAIALPIKSSQGATEFAHTIVHALERPYNIYNERVQLDVAAGISIWPDDGSQVEDLLHHAESAVALSGISTQASHVYIFDESMHEERKKRAHTEQALRRAFECDLIDVYLQPKSCLATASTLGFEALARWNDEQGNPVSPVLFVAIAEETGLGAELDRYILRKVVSSISDTLATGQQCRTVAVNITAQHFNDHQLVDHVSSLLNEYKVPASLIELEVTESAILSVTPKVQDNLLRLRELGIRVSIDDFGTGYSSLAYLKDLNVDAIKIDKSFVDHIEEENGLQLVKAIISIAQSLNLDVIAEGIETEQQKQHLLRNGCVIGQGFYFSKPLPFQEAVNKLNLS